MDKTISKIGNEIRKAREHRGYSTEELASILNISAGKLNNIENAKNDCFQVELINRINEKLGINIYLINNNIEYENPYEGIYNEFLNEIIEFLKFNSEEVNKLFIEKIDYEIYTLNKLIKTISES